MIHLTRAAAVYYDNICWECFLYWARVCCYVWVKFTFEINASLNRKVCARAPQDADENYNVYDCCTVTLHAYTQLYGV